MVLHLAHTPNVDNDDSYKSLTPVNEIQAFIPNDVEYGTASLMTSLSATSDSSTPKLDSRKMSNAYTETSYVTHLKKSSILMLSSLQPEFLLASLLKVEHVNTGV